jgi:hypothetical protein
MSGLLGKSGRTLAIITIAQLLIFSTTAGATWFPTYNSGEAGVVLTDSAAYQQGSILLNLSPSVQAAPENNETICTADATSGPCDFGAPGDSANSALKLPVCTSASQTNCVASLTTGTATTPPAPCTYVRMTDGYTVAADPTIDLPEGSTVGVWQCPTPDAAGSDNYDTNVMLGMDFNQATGVFDPSYLLAAVQPFVQVGGSYQTPEPSSYTAPNGVTGVAYQQQVLPSCAFQETGICGMTQDFASGTIATLSLRITNQIGGWFSGRLFDPTMAVVPFDSTSNLLTITAQSVTVPSLEATAPFPDPTPSTAVQDCFAPNGGFPSSASFELNQSTASNAFAIVDGCRDLVSDTASGISTEWSVNSVSAEGNGCLTNTSQILGLVTTNAMAYEGAAPTFSGGFFSYGVAGMHYLPDGSLALGNYDMIVADSVAQCLYGFTNAPISATISVTEDGAAENVSTTSVSDAKGWLHLAAYGFTFSNPTISMKLTQAVAKPKPKPRRVTITCVRGKKVKRVTGVSPRCPAHYKRKK